MIYTQPKYIEAVFPLCDCPIPLIGEDIVRFLNGCQSVLVFAATLGEDFDRWLRKEQLVLMSSAVLHDLKAGEYLEDFLDAKVGKRRFSPGYGDFPLSVNLNIVTALNASTKIGLCVTDEYILTPQKSITGVIPVI
jgi:cobalamin-dependent methionine synthase I